MPEDKWLLDMKRGHQVLFLRYLQKSWCPADDILRVEASFRSHAIFL